jgi:hypothetical protein
MNAALLAHVIAGFALVAVCFVIFGWGLLRARQATPPGPRSEQWWVQLVALAHTLVLGCGMAGVVLWLVGSPQPSDPLHARIYGPFMLVMLLGAWSFRTADRRWNIRVMAVVCLFVALLGVRAITTGY